MAKRPKSAEFKVFPAEGGYRVLQRASARDGELMEAMGIWRREYDNGNGTMLGFRVIGIDARKVDSDLKSMHSSAAISRAEMELNVERSRTFGLREADRMARMKNGDAPEDRVERVKAKVRVYAYVTAARGDILRVWPR